MEFYDDLTDQQKKHPFRFIVGLLSFVLAIFWFLDSLSNTEPLSLFAWGFFAFLLFNGIWHVWEGMGLSINRLFGKACIIINEEIIYLKDRIFGSALKLSWDLVKSISFKSYRVEVLEANGNCVEFDLSKMNFKQFEKVKQAIRYMAEKKEIGIVEH